MKKFFILVLIAILIFLGFKAYRKILDRNKRWQVQILEPFINVRTDPDLYSYAVARVVQGDRYFVLDIYRDDSKYVWYKINYKGDAYWIASDRDNPFVKEYKNPEYGNADIDYKNPTITNFEEEYHIKDSKSIEYDHLAIEDEHDYTVSHEIFFEEESEETGEPQYWIRYTIIDSYNNKTVKTQKISFDIDPNPREVKDISELTSNTKDDKDE